MDTVKIVSAAPTTVQSYIDETPVWKDGTSTGTTPLTRMQWRIWYLATAGKFFEGMVVFMKTVSVGQANPAIVINRSERSYVTKSLHVTET